MTEHSSDVTRSDVTRTKVTRTDVEKLWAGAISGRSSRLDTSSAAELLLGEANSENPIVNWGLHTLHDLRRSPAEPGPAALIDSCNRWRRQLDDYDADPDGWMRGYFRTMISRHAQWRGVDAARAFGAKLVRQGHLQVSDIDRALGG